MRLLPDLGKWLLEIQMQCHLQESRAAESVLDYAELTGRRARIRALDPDSRGLCVAGCVACTDVIRRIAEERVEPHVVIRRIEAWVIEHVESLHIEAKNKPLFKFEVFEEREVDARLEWATEFVAAR